jgi:prophage DNA circulation protein
MGQAPSAFSLSGFVVGDDCYAQAIALRNASIQAGSGTLVHPWLGTVTVAQVSPPKMSVRKDLGRVVQIDFEFVQTGSSVYPSVVTDTGGAVDDAADDLDDAAGESFGDQIADAVQVGTSIVQQGASIAQAAVNTVAGVVSNVESAVQDASLVVHAVAGLPAAVNMNFGRFADGARSTLLTGINTVDGAIAAVSQARSAVSNAVATVNAAANSL